MLNFTEFSHSIEPLSEGRKFQGGFSNLFYSELSKAAPKMGKKIDTLVHPYLFNKELGAYDMDSIATTLKIDVSLVRQAYKDAVLAVKSLGLMSSERIVQGLPISGESGESKFKELMGLSKTAKISYFGGKIYIFKQYFMVELKPNGDGDPKTIRALIDSPLCVYAEIFKGVIRIFYKPKENFVVGWITNGAITGLSLVTAQPTLPKDNVDYIIYDLSKESVVDSYYMK